jgi:hypothetical protein
MFFLRFINVDTIFWLIYSIYSLDNIPFYV